MESAYSPDGLELKRDVFAGASCTMGVFDGMHRGHVDVINAAKLGPAGESGGFSLERYERPCIAITFDKDPDEVLGRESLLKLMDDDQRIEAVANMGYVDGVVVIPFTPEFARLAPEEFLDAVFGQSVPASLTVGADFRFGAQAAGDVGALKAWGDAHGMRVEARPLLADGAAPITSTRIRALLQEGDVDEANRLLGHHYAVRGVVAPGRQQGREFGIRTANLEIPPARMVLADGVYGGYALVEGHRNKAAISVGVSPMFAEETKANVEVHILGLDCAGDALYGLPLEVEFVHWLRPMQTFASTDELIAAISGDIAWVRENL